MAYFPHAYQKLLLATAGIIAAPAAGADTLSIQPAQLGVVNARTHKLVPLTAPDYQATPLIYLAQGSLHKSDKLGRFHGGYKETIKSKGINPKYVSRFYVTQPQEAAKHVITVAPTGEFDATVTYRLRVDVKGSQALRLLTHNAYRTLDARIACKSGALSTQDKVELMHQFADQITADNVLGQLLTATVDGNGTLTITAGYDETVFGMDSYAVNDHVEQEPLFVYASFVDEFENPCYVMPFTVTEVQEPRFATGLGSTVLKELILSNRYLQEPFQHDPRMREVLDDTNLKAVDRDSKYTAYHILHSIPVRANGNSQMEADQYLLKIVVPERNVAFENFFEGLLQSAGNAVNLEVVPNAPAQATPNL